MTTVYQVASGYAECRRTLVTLASESDAKAYRAWAGDDAYIIECDVISLPREVEQGKAIYQIRWRIGYDYLSVYRMANDYADDYTMTWARSGQVSSMRASVHEPYDLRQCFVWATDEDEARQKGQALRELHEQTVVLEV